MLGSLCQVMLSADLMDAINMAMTETAESDVLGKTLIMAYATTSPACI